MNRLLLRVLCCLALVTGAMSLMAQTTTFVSPVPFYRFRVSNTNLGYLYTASFQEGVNAGFTPDGALHNSNGVIGFVVVPPTQDSIPVAGQGLVPLHRLRVIESGRAYWYLTTSLGTYGSNYTYEGIAGYALNLSDSRPGFTLTAYYSQSYGYWFSVGERVPDAQYFSPYGPPPPGDCPFVYYDFSNGLYYCSTYSNHGSIAKLMWDQSGQFQFTTPAPPPPPPPPPPPGECTAGSGIIAKCGQLGGSWDHESCSCQY